MQCPMMTETEKSDKTEKRTSPTESACSAESSCLMETEVNVKLHNVEEGNIDENLVSESNSKVC